MRIKKYTYARWFFVGIFSIVLFVGLAQFSQMHRVLLQELMTQVGVIGVLSYIVLLALAIIIAPVSTAFLLPIAANSWGPFLAALYSIIGWTIGSLVAFILARKFGVRLVERFEPVRKISSIEKSLPKKSVFWYVVLLRLALPVDILSYALGLFSSMTLRSFLLSTIIGITPFSLLFTYASVSNIWTQGAVGLLGIIVFIGGSYYVYVRSKSTTSESKQGSDIYNKTNDNTSKY